MNRRYVYLLIFIFPFFYFLRSFYALAQTSSSDSVDATVKISVCGNGIAEGGEDCDLEDLNGQSCATVGFTIGDLECDKSCNFDTSNCILIPTPTPTPTCTPTTTPITSSVSSITPTAKPLTPTSTPTIKSPFTLFPIISLFDVNNNGKIEMDEVYEAISFWVEAWRKETTEKASCDINLDRDCNLVDISILLYYVEI